MGIKLYSSIISPPCRAVLVTGKMLGVEFDVTEVNLVNGETQAPEFIAMNPQHAVPILDDGFYLTESRAIIQYLANAYGDETFYPKDPKKRAIVDQRLYFEGTTLYPTFANAYYCIFLTQTKPEAEKVAKFDEVLGYLEGFLTKSKYVAGDDLTIADFSLMACLTTMKDTFGHDFSKYEKILAYIDTCKKDIKDFDDVNQAGIDSFGQMIQGILKNLP